MALATSKIALASFLRAQELEADAIGVEVTHWSHEDVEQEKHIRERDVRPQYTLEHSYAEILELFEFGGCGINGQSR
jgi:hypothetical protein